MPVRQSSFNGSFQNGAPCLDSTNREIGIDEDLKASYRVGRKTVPATIRGDAMRAIKPSGIITKAVTPIPQSAIPPIRNGSGSSTVTAVTIDSGGSFAIPSRVVDAGAERERVDSPAKSEAGTGSDFLRLKLGICSIGSSRRLNFRIVNHSHVGGRHPKQRPDSAFGSACRTQNSHLR